MTVLPLIERELRVRARGRSAYWTRCYVALVGVLICLPQLFSPILFRTAAQTGSFTFDGMVAVAFILCCCACLLTADAISGELRDGTLGLLLLTRVNALDLLLAKMASAGITTMAALITLLPLLAIPAMAGGVTGGEILRQGLALLNLLFFALAAGLCASTLARSRFKAAGLALLIILLMTFGPFPFWSMRIPVLDLAGYLSPLVTIVCAADIRHLRYGGTYWSSLILVQALSWLLLVAAGKRVRRIVLELGGSEPEPIVQSVFGRHWHRLLEDNPVRWLILRPRGLYVLAWAAALISVSYALVYMLVVRVWLGMKLMSWWATNWVPGLAVNLISGSIFAWIAARFFIEARRTGELELLLTTPFGAKTVVSGQWSALKIILRWPVLFMIILPSAMHFWSMRRGGGNIIHSLSYVGLLMAGINVLLAMAALCWTGIWWGLKASGQARAILGTITLAKIVPYLLNVIAGVFFQKVFSVLRLSSNHYYLMMACLFPLVLGSYYMGLIFFARRCVFVELLHAKRFKH